MPRPKKFPPTDTNVAIGYVVGGQNVDLDRAYMAAEAGRRGLSLIDLFSDPVLKPLPDLDGFVDALVAVEGKGVGVVLTVDVVSVAANPAQHALVQRAIERAGATWVPCDPTVPWPPDVVQDVLVALKQHESMIYRPKVRLGMRGGPDVRPGGPPAWGFRRGADGQFEPDPDEHRAVAQALQMRADGRSLTEIAKFLEGLCLPNRPRNIPKSTVQSMFQRLDRKKP